MCYKADSQRDFRTPRLGNIFNNYKVPIAEDKSRYQMTMSVKLLDFTMCHPEVPLRKLLWCLCLKGERGLHSNMKAEWYNTLSCNNLGDNALDAVFIVKLPDTKSTKWKSDHHEIILHCYIHTHSLIHYQYIMLSNM